MAAETRANEVAGIMVYIHIYVVTHMTTGTIDLQKFYFLIDNLPDA